MASTLTSGTLIVNTREECVLDGSDVGGTRAFTEPSIRVYSRQFRKIVTDISDPDADIILSFNGSPTDRDFDNDDVKYVRVTNLDGANDLAVVLGVTGGGNYTFRIKPGHSFTMGSPNDYFKASLGAPNIDVVQIKAAYITGPSIDIEIVVGSA